MKKIKIMLIIISITFISLSCKDPILEPDPLEEEASLISWDRISGKIAYKKNNTLYLADKKSRTVKNLGKCYLFNLKWNKAGNEITGILDNNNEYSIEAYDLNGNHYELDEPSSFSKGTYDWLPDGRLAHLTKLGFVYIENSKLIDHNFNAFGMACSPDGKKIVVSGWNSSDSTEQLTEIDIATGGTSILESEKYRGYSDPVYSPDSKKVLFVKSMYNWFSGPTYSLWITPDISLPSGGQNPNWSPDGQRIIYRYTDSYLETTNIYSMTINGDNGGVAIPGGSNPLWIE